MNIVAGFHAYKFTHFATENSTRTKDPRDISFMEKLGTLFFGIENPRPFNRSIPKRKFGTISIKSNKLIECWNIKTDSAKGTIILFHGYGGYKSSMLDKADEFLNMGYNTLLVDFRGSGGSEGNQTTIGFKEADDVKACFEYLKAQGEKNIILFGTSMGAVSILKTISDHKISPSAIIIECPFGSMYQTTSARFKLMNLPSFPMAGLLVFLGGIENGFWAFSHQPVEYAKGVKCPTLLLYGEKDDRVSRQEINEIYKNLDGRKKLRTYKEAGHENYLKKYRKEWIADIEDFLLPLQTHK